MKLLKDKRVLLALVAAVVGGVSVLFPQFVAPVQALGAQLVQLIKGAF